MHDDDDVPSEAVEAIRRTALSILRTVDNRLQDATSGEDLADMALAFNRAAEVLLDIEDPLDDEDE